MTLSGGLSTVDIALQNVCHICLCFSWNRWASSEIDKHCLVDIARWCKNITGQSFDIITVHKFLEAVFIKKSTKVKRKGKRICGQWQEGFTCAWLEPSVLRKHFLILFSCNVLEFQSFCKQGLDILIVWRCSWWSFKARNRLLRQSGKNNYCVWLFQLTERWRTLADYTLESLIRRPQLRVSWI